MKQSAYSDLSRRQALRGLLMTGGLLLVPGLARAFVPAAGAAPYVRTGFHMGTMVTISLARCSEAQAQEAVAAAFAECRDGMLFCENARRLLWEKLFINMTLNSLSSVLECRLYEIYAYE